MAYDPNIDYQALAAGKTDAEIAQYAQQNGFSGHDLAKALGTTDQTVKDRGYNTSYESGYAPGVISNYQNPTINTNGRNDLDSNAKIDANEAFSRTNNLYSDDGKGNYWGSGNGTGQRTDGSTYTYDQASPGERQNWTGYGGTGNYYEAPGSTGIINTAQTGGVYPGPAGGGFAGVDRGPVNDNGWDKRAFIPNTPQTGGVYPGPAGGGFAGVDRGPVGTDYPGAPTGIINTAQMAKLGNTTPWNITSDQTTLGQMNAINNPNSPFIQQARTAALEQMNGRGLLNSSMALSAADAAAYQAAIPIAQSDAATYAKAGGYNADQMNQFALADFNAAHGTDLANISAATSRYGTDVGAQTSRYNTDVGAQTSKYNTDVNAQTSKYSTDVGANTSKYNTDANNSTTRFTAGLDAQTKQNVADLNAATTRYTANLDANTKKTLQDMQAGVAANNNANSTGASIYHDLQIGIANIQNNPNLDANAKQIAMTNLIGITKNGLDILGRVTGGANLGDLLTFGAKTSEETAAEKAKQDQAKATTNTNNTYGGGQYYDADGSQQRI